MPDSTTSKSGTTRDPQLVELVDGRWLIPTFFHFMLMIDPFVPLPCYILLHCLKVSWSYLHILPNELWQTWPTGSVQSYPMSLYKIITSYPVFLEIKLSILNQRYHCGYAFRFAMLLPCLHRDLGKLLMPHRLHEVLGWLIGT